jgi:hypothetical protein
VLRGFLLVCVSVLSLCSPVFGATLSDRFSRFLQGRLEPMTASFGRAVGRSVPVLAASPASHYEYDPDTGAYSNRQTTGGQLFLEHAETLGKGHLAVGLDYLHVQLDRFEGKSLRDLSDPRPRIDTDGTPLASFPSAAVDVTADQWMASFTYGVLSWLDVNAVVPLEYTQLRRDDSIRTFPGNVGGSTHDVATGIGDLQLRAKALLGDLGRFSWAAGLGLRIPTGDRDDFQGTGDYELTPSLIASTKQWAVGPDVWLQGYLNLAMLIDLDQTSRWSEGRWGVGLDLGFSRVQIAVGLLGRSQTGPILSADEVADLTTLSCVGPVRGCLPVAPPARRVKTTLFDFTEQRPNYIDGTIGIRVGLWANRVTAVVGMLAPLLDEGLITDPTPVAGIEAVF